MWVVLRKNKAQNLTLMQFFSDLQQLSIKAGSIIKFGRVNFKVTAVQSKRLLPEVQSSTPQSMNANIPTENKQHPSQSYLNNFTDNNFLDQPSTFLQEKP
mmetsp:Transcript_41524/g.39943  ORF Transcript_41524/g.39943 Transcript_41524/m.39943 type:complete len:100 (+) Transcript_41524:167-466(+)